VGERIVDPFPRERARARRIDEISRGGRAGNAREKRHLSPNLHEPVAAQVRHVATRFAMVSAGGATAMCTPRAVVKSRARESACRSRTP
jgi:hypothetical protein